MKRAEKKKEEERRDGVTTTTKTTTSQCCSFSSLSCEASGSGSSSSPFDSKDLKKKKKRRENLQTSGQEHRGGTDSTASTAYVACQSPVTSHQCQPVCAALSLSLSLSLSLFSSLLFSSLLFFFFTFFSSPQMPVFYFLSLPRLSSVETPVLMSYVLHRINPRTPCANHCINPACTNHVLIILG